LQGQVGAFAGDYFFQYIFHTQSELCI
jgi:hypothetical protein